YLEGYEKLYFLGEDADDTAASRVNLFSLGGYGSPQMPMMYRDPQRNFERLVLSLQSGLPNEVDFAINICVLLSNVNNSVFNLTKAPAVIDMILAHVGVFEEDSCSSSDLYKEWYKNSEKDFLKFWQRVLNCEEIKQLLPKFDKTIEEHDTDFLFNLDATSTQYKDFELQRVLQVCTILHNFSFDRMNASVLSSHPVCIRFLMFCLHCNIGSLKKLATDTITNLADKMILEPLESLNSQLFFFMIARYLRDADRHNRICGMNILKKVCLQEENQDFVCTALDVETYEALITVLIVDDVQLLIPSLETLYQLTCLGQVPCDCVVAVEKSIEMLVSILHLCVESFGAEMLADVKIIDNHHGVAMVPNVSGNKQSSNKLLANSPDPRQKSDAESEATARHWLRNVYEFDMSSTVLQRDLYADYVTSCGKATRNVLNVPSFYKLIKSAHPNIQIVKLTAANQQLFGVVGLRRKLPPGQYFMQTSIHHGARVPQGGTPPQLRQSRTTSPPMAMDTSHVPSTPTPPMRTEGLATNISIRPQSPSLPGQRHDVIFPNARPSPQPSSIQLPIRPPANSGPVAQPSGMSASEFLGSLVGTRHPLPSFSNLVSSSAPTMTSSSPRQISVDARLPDLVAGKAGQVVTSSPKTEGLPKSRMPDVVVGVAGTANGDRLLGSCEPANSSDKCDVGQPKNTDQSALTKVSQNKASVSSQKLPSVVKKTLLVNDGTVEVKLKCQAAVVNTSPAKLPAVNGGQTNGVLYVGKEERATKMAPEGHEVVISVVENPRKQSTGPSEEMNSESLALGKKRPKAMISDITAADMPDSALHINTNGPFTASEMLRNVAKRQRRHSEDASLVNGTAEQKGPMAWDELVRAQPKPLVVTSPKLPIAVNGVRLDILPEHVKDYELKADLSTNSEKMLHTKPNNPHGNMANTANLGNHGNVTNTTLGNVTNTTLGNHGSTTNITLGNHGNVTNASSLGHVTNTTIGNHGNTTNTTANQSGLKSPGVPTTNVVPGSLPPVTTQGQSSGGNAVTRSDTITVGVTTPKDQNAGDSPRGEQVASVVLPYRCLWAACNCSFANSKLLYNHAVSAHAPVDQMFTSCQWEGCTHVRRSRASLLFHLRQRHLTPTQAKDPNLVPKPQKASPPVGLIPPPTGAQPTTAPAHGRPVFPPHPSVNPLLLNLKEQLLQTEQESPLTKSIRLTAALVLRNIAKYSPSGRRKLKRFETSFTQIMCSKLESNGAIAACLHEMTRPRQEDNVPKR
ncbi:AT-rich interactive domain-containing 2, partial [Paramuricea clavata]